MPFEEDDNDPNIWFFDHSYMEAMYKMFKKVNGERGLEFLSCCLSSPYVQPPFSPLPVHALLLLVCVAAREKVVGWYSTGPKIRQNDLDINALVAKYADWPPTLVVCEVQVSSITLFLPKPLSWLAEW